MSKKPNACSVLALLLFALSAYAAPLPQIKLGEGGFESHRFRDQEMLVSEKPYVDFSATCLPRHQSDNPGDDAPAPSRLPARLARAHGGASPRPRRHALFRPARPLFMPSPADFARLTKPARPQTSTPFPAPPRIGYAATHAGALTAKAISQA